MKIHKIDINVCHNKLIITNKVENMKVILGMGNKRNLAIFCQFVENIRNICDFITIHFKENEFYTQGMSEDHCSIFELTISSEWFEFYEKKESDRETLTLRTSTLAKVLDTRQKSQFLVIEYEGNPNKINIILKNKPKDEITNEYPKEFEIPLITMDHELLTIPDKEYAIDFNIDSTNIRNIVEQLMLFDNVIGVKCNEETIEFKSNGEDGTMTINLFDEDDKYVDEFAIEEDYELENEFHAKHFHNFCKFNKIAKRVEMSFTKDFPLCFQYQLDGDQSDLFTLKFLLAPQIKDD
jgi:proliferating cell nuclear antigen PCNA